MVVMMMVLLLQLCQILRHGSGALHGGHQLLAGELIPGGGDDGCGGIVLPQLLHSGIQLGLGNGVGSGQDDGGCGFDLVVVELAEVLHIHLHLASIGNGHGIAQGNLVIGHLPDGADDIAELAHAGGLDEDAVGMVGLDDIPQSLAEVTHQRAADAAGVHLGDVDSGILQEAAVNADLTELILNEHQLLTLVGLGNHLLDQRGLAGSEESGINIDFHSKHLLL